MMSNSSKKTVPGAVADSMKRLGYNTAEYVATDARGDIYALERADANGMPEPMGLPAFAIAKGNSCTIVYGDEGLELSRLLFGEE